MTHAEANMQSDLHPPLPSSSLPPASRPSWPLPPSSHLVSLSIASVRAPGTRSGQACLCVLDTRCEQTYVVVSQMLGHMNISLRQRTRTAQVAGVGGRGGGSGGRRGQGLFPSQVAVASRWRHQHKRRHGHRRGAGQVRRSRPTHPPTHPPHAWNYCLGRYHLVG